MHAQMLEEAAARQAKLLLDAARLQPVDTAPLRSYYHPQVPDGSQTTSAEPKNHTLSSFRQPGTGGEHQCPL